MDVICISETWFDPNINDEMFQVEGYKLFRADRVERAGGVAMYVRKSLKCHLLQKSDSNSNVEYLFLVINGVNGPVLVSSVYRRNNRIDFKLYTDLLANISIAYKDIIVVGDFNCNILIDNSLTNNMETLGLKPTNKQSPTHFSGCTSTLLDIFFVSCIDKTLHYDQISAPCFSRHDLIYLTYAFNSDNTEQHMSEFSFRDFKNINLELLANNFNSIDWDSIFFMTSPQDQILFLQDNVNSLFNNCVPTKVVKQKRQKIPWFNRDIEAVILERNALYKRWKRYKLPSDYEKFKKLRSRVNKLIRDSKKNYFEDRFKRATNSKQKWSYIREIGIGCKKQTILDANLDVELLNLQFSSSTPSDQVSFTHELTNNNENAFYFSNVTQSEVYQAISSIKSNATGFDLVSPRFLKMLLPYLLPYLTHIFNSILTSSNYPVAWKSAKVLPVPKSGNELRPICILPIVSKAFEKVMNAQILHYLNINSLLFKYQSGFRRNHSCLTALVQVSEDIRSSIDKNQVVFLGLLDFTKAFLNVDHYLMLVKLLNEYNFSTPALRLIQSYLMNRQQAVCIGGRVSSFSYINKGVPQGSILGPLLFALYINDLPQYLSRAKVHLYADDVQIYLNCDKDKTDSCAIEFNSELSAIKNWADSNKLTLNPSKCKCIVISKRGIDATSVPDILIGNEAIEKAKTAKNLGIIFNNRLTFEDHIRNAIGKTYGMLRCLWFSQSFTPKHIRVLLVKSYIVPFLLYNCELYVNMDCLTKHKLKVCFNNILRYVFGLKRFESTSYFATQLFNMNLDKLLDYRSLLFLHKIIYSGQPDYLCDHIHLTQSHRTMQIRPILFQSLVSERHFFVNTIRLWNALPPYMQNTSSVPLFKKQLALTLAQEN